MNKNILSNVDAIVGAIEMPVVTKFDCMTITDTIICGITISMAIC